MLDTVLRLEELNAQQRTRKEEAHEIQPGKDAPTVSDGEFGEIGFTAKDREALIRLTVLQEELGKTLVRYESRFDRIEKERLSKDEAAAQMTLLQKQVNDQAVVMAKTELTLSKIINDLETRCNKSIADLQIGLAATEKTVWMWIARIGGAATAVGVMVGIITGIVFHYWK